MGFKSFYYFYRIRYLGSLCFGRNRNTDFPLSLGINNGGETYSAPDRILWQGESWRLASLRDWSPFGYVQALAVKLHE